MSWSSASSTSGSSTWTGGRRSRTSRGRSAGCPPSIDGQERELEWLTNMRDWMISKKRFWGLALPIWVDEKTGEFDGHRLAGRTEGAGRRGLGRVRGAHAAPSVDRSREDSKPDDRQPACRACPTSAIRGSTRESFPSRRSNTTPTATNWRKWYPADLVLECFPGQFRNWFYSMLSMATMMDGSPPFKTLFGHRLVMNEEGKPMHKSDGTAIWFEEAAEQLGVDTMRWMYLAQNPAYRSAVRHAAPQSSRNPAHAGRPDRANRGGRADLRSREQAGRRDPPPGADPAVEHVRVLRELRAARRIRSAHAG